MRVKKFFNDARRQKLSHEISLLGQGVAGVLAYSGYTESHNLAILQGAIAWALAQVIATVILPEGGTQ
ncbi:hypothetical protein [Acidithiobacillus caldus]|uniref:Uncharacterized protein n=1 Tax=Acidithiobacillus caldus TaxID=33059 RepID=A0A1E7YPQ7_9PROT|nr:hypothetical protein [Acidithiobacillus caldus]OFC37623.1 hypothetical protein BAE29_10270 [Acidithiobacillus caldus]OFC37715.1 hypothetical protein BAE28_06805 [Acidithiobacillus caldus]OFC37881.1 hypothetical protein BAE27_03375 [Acidithiobacillus caldus]